MLENGAPVERLVRIVDGYEIWAGAPIPDTVHGRKPYDETKLILKYIEGRKQGVYKSHLKGAEILAHETGNPYTDYNTHVDRLRRKFSDAWKQHTSNEPITIK